MGYIFSNEVLLLMHHFLSLREKLLSPNFGENSNSDSVAELQIGSKRVIMPNHSYVFLFHVAI